MNFVCIIKVYYGLLQCLYQEKRKLMKFLKFIAVILSLLSVSSLMIGMQIPSKRLFLALSLPKTNGVGQPIDFTGVEKFIANNGITLKPEKNRHITLLFLGDVPDYYYIQGQGYSTLELLSQAVNDGLKFFYSYTASKNNSILREEISEAKIFGKNNNFIVYTLKQPSSLEILYDFIQNQIKLEFNKRGIQHQLNTGFPFAPHITLGTFNPNDAMKMQSLLNGFKPPAALNRQTFILNELTLFESKNQNYIPLRTWKLASPQ